MQNLTRRVGFWLLVVMAGGYTIGNYALGSLKERYEKIAHDQHNDAQTFSMRGVDTLQVDGANINAYIQLNIAFDASSSLATVVNKNLSLTINGAADQGTLTLSAVRSKNSNAYLNNQIDITLPVNVRQIRLDFGGIVHLGGQLPGEDSALRVAISHCASQLNVGSLKVNRIVVDVTCSPKAVANHHNAEAAPENPYANSMMTAGQSSQRRPIVRFADNANVDDLELRMATGELHYMGETTPTRIALALGVSKAWR